MFQRAILFFAMFVLAAGCSVSALQEAPKIESENNTNAETNKPENILFAHDDSAFSLVYKTANYNVVKIEKVPKEIDPQDGEPRMPTEAPEHYCFNLGSNKEFPAFEQGPRYFFPAYSFICLIPLEDSTEDNFTKAYPYIDEAGKRLRKLLAKRPNKLDENKNFLDLPYKNADYSFKSKIQYVNFKSGSGVLFLTQYSQDMLPNPANNEELTCNFQGLTTDGKYYIAVRLGVTHPSLPRGIDYTDYIELDDKYLYLKKAEKEINEFPDNSFQPSLNDLKEMISSISIK